MHNHHKFYDGINEDNVKKAKEELLSQGYDILDIKYLDLQDKFVISYIAKIAKPITQPPPDDLVNPEKEYHSVDYPQKKKTALEIYLIEYWYVALAIVLSALYYFFVYRGSA